MIPLTVKTCVNCVHSQSPYPKCGLCCGPYTSGTRYERKEVDQAIKAGDEVELLIHEFRPADRLRLKVLGVVLDKGAAMPAMLRVRLPLADKDAWLNAWRFAKVKDKDES